MATYSSGLITNLTSSPIVKNDVSVSGGRKRVELGTVGTGATSVATGDVLRLCRIPTSVVITSIKIYNDDFGTTVPADLGFFKTDGTAVDSNALIAAGTLLQTASTSGAEYRFSALNITTIAQRAWQLAGETEDPGGLYEIRLTVGTVSGGAAGDLSFDIEYTID